MIWSVLKISKPVEWDYYENEEDEEIEKIIDIKTLTIKPTDI